MSLFKDMLKGGESLFVDPMALDYDYLPKLLPFRENEQHHIANSIKPLLANNRSGKNLLIHGAPGIGKTAAMRFVLRDLENETDAITCLYVNCWQKNSTYKILSYFCEQLGFKFIQNKKTDELFKLLKDKINKSSAVFVFDEIDKAEDYDFLYLLLEDIFRKCIFLVTNYKDWVINLDMRIKSRLMPELLEFKQYNEHEITEILRMRNDLAFAPNVWDKEAFDIIAQKTYDISDIRSGLHMLREAGNNAENESKTKVQLVHAAKAIESLGAFNGKDTGDLGDETQTVLKLARTNPEIRIGDLYKLYRKSGGKVTYKTFQRYISKLAENKFICVEKIPGGPEGNTTIIKLATPENMENDEKDTTLNEFKNAG